jgi:hypothetical protein
LLKGEHIIIDERKMNMPDQDPTSQIISRAMKDQAFRQELIANPNAVLERELGVPIPQGMTIYVHENTSTSRHLTLPAVSQVSSGQELSDAELEEIAGGRMCTMSGTFHQPQC